MTTTEQRDFTTLTHRELIATASRTRPGLVEAFLLATIAKVAPEAAADLETPLLDVGFDSLQAIEVKFALDELIGQESDPMLILDNPSIRKLAQASLRAAGL